MKLHIGDYVLEGTIDEIRQYLEYNIGDYSQDTYDQEEEFTVVFKDCDGTVSSASLKGDDAAFLEPVVKAFLKAYENSGFCNELTVTIGNKIFGDKSYKVEAKV